MPELFHPVTGPRSRFRFWASKPYRSSKYSLSGRQDSNLRRTAWKADTLPLSYARLLLCLNCILFVKCDEKDNTVLSFICQGLSTRLSAIFLYLLRSLSLISSRLLQTGYFSVSGHGRSKARNNLILLITAVHVQAKVHYVLSGGPNGTRTRNLRLDRPLL